MTVMMTDNALLMLELSNSLLVPSRAHARVCHATTPIPIVLESHTYLDIHSTSPWNFDHWTFNNATLMPSFILLLLEDGRTFLRSCHLTITNCLPPHHYAFARHLLLRIARHLLRITCHLLFRIACHLLLRIACHLLPTITNCSPPTVTNCLPLPFCN